VYFLVVLFVCFLCIVMPLVDSNAFRACFCGPSGKILGVLFVCVFSYHNLFGEFKSL
jgi:hypothetical protein